MPSATTAQQSQVDQTEDWVSVSSTPTEIIEEPEEEEVLKQLPTPSPTPPRVRFQDGDVLTTAELYAKVRELEEELEFLEERYDARREEEGFEERMASFRLATANKENIPPLDYIKQETVDETCFDAGALLSQLDLPRQEHDDEDRLNSIRLMRKNEPRMRKSPHPSKKWVMSRIYPKRFRGTVWKGERSLSRYGQVGLAAIDDALAIHAREVRELITDRQFIVRWAS